MSVRILLMLVLIVSAADSYAGAPGCTGTAPVMTCNSGLQGKIIFGSELPYYCNGSSWIQMCHATLGGACTSGEIAYSGGLYKACGLTSAVWFNLKGTSNGACSAAETGKMKMVGTQLEYCDGSSWFLF